MKRRDAITGFVSALLAHPLSAAAQVRPNLHRIGFVRVGEPPPAFINALKQGLLEFGLKEGTDFELDMAITRRSVDMAGAVAELVARRVDILFASGAPAVVPAKDGAGTVPVVFVATVDPVATGIVASLGRPQGNITGVTSISGDLVAKRFQLVKELLPTTLRIAILVRQSSPAASQETEQARKAAAVLGVELQILAERDPDDLEQLIAEVRKPGALIIADDAEFTANRARIAQIALQHKLPTVFGFREMVEAGGLMSYGANFADLYRRAASHVHKILRGTKPIDLPVEQPIRFEFILNMRTARTIGLDIPVIIQHRIDEVIE
jgi:putative tryptophan/tyrosine transport system substrate-binding protein